MIDAALYGRFETSIVHLQGFCLKLYPQLEHITATRHILPAHRTLLWVQEESKHAIVVHEYLETWLHLQVSGEDEDSVSIGVLEDAPLRTEQGRRRIEQQLKELEGERIPFVDSRPLA
jgi:hypothetical protein